MTTYAAKALRGYLETILWAETDNADESGGAPLDANYTIEDFAPASLAAAKADVDAFLTANAETLADPSCADAATVGHDFWLTRNGHGAGFWDGDYPEAIGNRLTEASKAFGSCDPVVGDDGQIHLC